MGSLPKTRAREQELLRMLRPPELRELPDLLYDTVVTQATRIVRSNIYIERLGRDIARSREAIADGIWPAVWGVAWDYNNLTDSGYATLLRDERAPRIVEQNGVFICWAIEAVAGDAGYAHLHAVRSLVAEYHNETPWGRHCPWGGFMNYGVAGAVGSWQHGGLTEHVAPLTWRLTPAGRELLAVVFGDDQ